jgi:hypothetical protein
MFQHPHGNFPSSEGLFSRGKLRVAHFLLQCIVYHFQLARNYGNNSIAEYTNILTIYVFSRMVLNRPEYKIPPKQLLHS